MRHAKLVSAGFTVFVALSGPAFSADEKFYVAVDAGTTRADGRFTGGSATNFVTVKRSDSSETLRARFGYQFWRYMAVEIGYIDFGDFAFRLTPANCPPAVPVNCNFTTHLSMRGPITNAVFVLPIGERWALKARVGAYHMRFKTRESGPDASSDSARGTDSEAGAQVGAAVSFRPTERVELDLAWTRISEPVVVDVNLVGAARFSPDDMGFTSLGVAFRF